jgi:hypothetical protein
MGDVPVCVCHACVGVPQQQAVEWAAVQLHSLQVGQLL